MPSVNNPNPINNPDPTSAVYSTFYNPPVYPVDVNTYDAAVAYFIQQGRSPGEAEKLADTIFRIAYDLTIPATELLSDIQQRRDLDIDAQLCYYLNQINSRTTLQGVTKPIQPNYYAQRAALD